MTAKINFTEFQTRLEENTQEGMPILKVSPLVLFTLIGKSSKKFYGKYTDNSFRFTKNTSVNVVPQTITGTYENTGGNETKIDYHIETIWFGWFWLRSIPVFLIGLTYLIYEVFGKSFLPFAIFVDLLLLLVHFYLIQTQKKDLIRFENDFKRIFEITE